MTPVWGAVVLYDPTPSTRPNFIRQDSADEAHTVNRESYLRTYSDVGGV